MNDIIISTDGGVQKGFGKKNNDRSFIFLTVTDDFGYNRLYINDYFCSTKHVYSKFPSLFYKYIDNK